jgi:uncharacterized paraquat-inducible protein A
MDSVFPEFFGIGLRVTGGDMDLGVDELEAVAKAVVEQLRDEGYAIKIRYSTYEQDSECTCVYCSAKRDNRSEYLCPKCKSSSSFGEPLALRYAYTFHGIEAPADA